MFSMDNNIITRVKTLLLENRDKLSEERKKKLILGLKHIKSQIKKKKFLSELDYSEERKVVAKKFEIKDKNFEEYVKSNRGLQFTGKERDAILGFSEKIKPTLQTPFFVKYETTDNFGNNVTTIVKKHREGNKLVFTAYNEYASVQMPDQKDESPPTKPIQPKKQQKSLEKQKQSTNKSISPPLSKKQPSIGGDKQLKEISEDLGENKIMVTKTIPFDNKNDAKSSDILSDFLRELDI